VLFDFKWFLQCCNFRMRENSSAFPGDALLFATFDHCDADVVASYECVLQMRMERNKEIKIHSFLIRSNESLATMVEAIGGYNIFSDGILLGSIEVHRCFSPVILNFNDTKVNCRIESRSMPFRALFGNSCNYRVTVDSIHEMFLDSRTNGSRGRKMVARIAPELLCKSENHAQAICLTVLLKAMVDSVQIWI